MRYSIRSVLLFVTGAALVAFAGTLNSDWFAISLTFFLTIVGTLIGRHRYWASCLFAGLGGGLGLWLVLLLHAFVLKWNNLTDTQVDLAATEGYRQFVRDSFIPQSAFLMVEGMLLGIFVATLFWVFTKLINRVTSSGLQSQES